MDMSINALRGNLSNPQKDFLWEIIIPTPVGGGEVEVFNLRAQSTTIPSRSQGQIKIPYKQTAGYMVPGKLSFDHTWACTFIEGEDKKVWNAINAWMNEIVNVNTGVGAGDSAVKTDALLSLIKVNNETSLTLKLKGCYILSRGEIQLNYENEKIVYYPVVFSFDSIDSI